MRDGKLHLDLCDFKLLTDQLNANETRHLTNVMNHVYGKQCSECELAVCFNRQQCEHVSHVRNEIHKCLVIYCLVGGPTWCESYYISAFLMRLNMYWMTNI